MKQNSIRAPAEPQALPELFSTAVLTSLLVKIVAVVMIFSLTIEGLFAHMLIYFGFAIVLLVLGLGLYYLTVNRLNLSLRLDAAYPVFSLALTAAVLLAAQQEFSHLNGLFFFPVVISTLLLGRKGLGVAFAGVVCLLALELFYGTQGSPWQIADNILTSTVLLFVAWLVGEATELNRATTASLADTSDLLQTTLDALPAGVLLQDHTGRTISGNRYLERLADGDEDVFQENLAAIRTLAAKPEGTVNPGAIRDADGGSVPVQVTRHPVTLDGREAQVLLVQNLSDRQKLRELDLMLHRLSDGWEIGVLFLDGDQRVRIHNQAARQLLQSDGDPDGAEVLRRLRGGSGTTELLVNDRYLLLDRSTWTNSPDGQPWTVITIHDLTQRRKAELELQRAHKLSSLGQIAAGVAHELRNPLTSIRGFAQLAAEQDDPEKSKRYLEIVLRETGHMHEILDRFLLMTKPSRPVYRVVDLRDTVLWVWKLLYNDSLHRQIQLERELPPEELTVQIDPQLMRQVILNLVSNALEATSAGGTVRLAAGGSGDEVRLTVADTGSGIPPGLLEEIFTPFVTTKDHGTGLGLAISNEIVREHGGTLKVESSPQGSTFHIILPRFRATEGRHS